MVRSALLAAAALALGANAHYIFPSVDGTSNWEYVRRADNWQSNGFVTDGITSKQMTCFQSTHAPASGTYSVAAGDSVTWTSIPAVFHPGPMQFYMAKVPEGQSIDEFDGSGDVWFKIYHEQPNFGGALSWESDGKGTFDVEIPSCIAPGEYLLRGEHIALHTASSPGGVQFYVSCAQISVSGGGSTEPSDKVAIPGAYSESDPGIQINVYYPVPTSYQNPGPSVFSC